MSFSAVDISHDWMKKYVSAGDVCIDATAGKGGDTLFLCSLVGENGRVLAFDIQDAAVRITSEKVRGAGFEDICRVILDGHENMDNYAGEESVSFICFNLGWLPGGDHSVFTRRSTTIPAIEKGLRLLKKGGAMSVCVYYGEGNGFEEKDAVLEYLPKVDPKKYTVLVTSFANRSGCQPIPILILKDS